MPALKAFGGEIGQVEAISRVNTALDSFEAVAARHAGDRERLSGLAKRLIAMGLRQGHW